MPDMCGMLNSPAQVNRKKANMNCHSHSSCPTTEVRDGDQPPLRLALSTDANGWSPFPAPACWTTKSSSITHPNTESTSNCPASKTSPRNDPQQHSATQLSSLRLQKHPLTTNLGAGPTHRSACLATSATPDSIGQPGGKPTPSRACTLDSICSQPNIDCRTKPPKRRPEHVGDDELSRTSKSRETEQNCHSYSSCPTTEVRDGDQPPLRLALSTDANGWSPFPEPDCWITKSS